MNRILMLGLGVVLTLGFLSGGAVAVGSVPVDTQISAAEMDGEGPVTAQENRTKQYDFSGGWIEETDLEIGENTTVRITITSYEPYETQFPILLHENGEATPWLEVVELRPGESETVEMEYGAFDGGEKEITVDGTASNGHHVIGTVNVEERDWGSGEEDDTAGGSTESNPDQNRLFGTVGYYLGIPILGIGVIGVLGAIGVEVLRSVKHHFGGGVTTGMKPAVAASSIGAIGMATGGVLVGGFGLAFTLFGVLLGLVLVVGFGGYYGMRRLWREL